MVPLRQVAMPVTGCTKKPDRSQARRGERVVRVFLSSTFRDMQDERDALVKDTFPKIKEACAKRFIFFSEVDLRWGITEDQSEQGDLVGICLAEVDKCRPYFIGIIGERYGYIPKNLKPEILAKYPFIAQLDSPRSVTELEMLYGALSADSATHALFYMRDPAVSDPAACDNEEKMRLLKRRIRVSGLPLKFFSSPVQLASFILRDMSDLIANDFPEETQPDPFEVKCAIHTGYAENQCKCYVRNCSYEAELADFISASDLGALVLVGTPGIGKSTLVSQWSMRAQELGGDSVVAYFVGTDGDVSPKCVLEYVLTFIKKEFGLVDQVPSTTQDLIREFPRWLTLVPSSRHLTVIIDGVSKLDSDGGVEMRWLPDTFPTNVKVIITAVAFSPTHTAALARNWTIMHAQPFTPEQKRDFTRQYLSLFGKSLAPDQEALICSAEQTSVPLFLRSLLEELRVHGNFELLNAKVRWYLEAPSAVELFVKILQRLEQDYGEALVREVMCLIFVSRRGVSENELLSILGGSQLQLSLFLESAHEHLRLRAGLLAFSHDYLRLAVQQYYSLSDTQPTYIRMLTNYFANGNGALDKRRKADELPKLMHQSFNREGVLGALCDIEVFLQLFTATRKYELKKYWLYAEPSRQSIGLRMNAALATYQSTVTPDVYRRVIMKVARFLREMLDYEGAKRLLQCAIEINTAHGGTTNHPSVAKAYYMLAEVYWNEGNLKEAEPFALQALAIRENTLGAEHLAVAESLCSIGELLISSDPAQAKQYLLRSLSIRLAHYGTNHTLVARCLQNLAVVADKEGDAEKAVLLCLQANDIRERMCGPLDRDLATGLESLATTYKLKGEPSKAEPLLLRAVNINVALHGPVHPSVESCYSWLALVYHDLGDAQAERQYTHLAVKTKEKLTELGISVGERVDD
eukprot:TRINITY_DN1285_c0_g1_i11.p1 TRINITY_DN1285_c0_g1~~TRINITY_DN1285_c0_g1_i11.p1  ORF type:complete len:1040 (+),score=182.05 TRINITY_DN1285_c0_g1_i11:363-3122(+)